MVAAVGYLVGYTGAGSLSLGGITLASGGALTLAGSALNIAGSLLLSAASNALLGPDQSAPRPENVQTNSRVTAGVRMRHYGLVKAGGNEVFHRARDGILYRVIVHGHGEIDSVEQVYLNNVPVDFDAQDFVTDDQYQSGGRSRVKVLGRNGVAPQAHHSEITAIWPEWTANHRLDGLWNSLIIAESVGADRFRKVYPSGEPTLMVLAKTTKCYDPRISLTAYTDNMALAIADYMASPDGFNQPNAFDDVNIAAQADICDQSIALAVGGTEKRYRISGSYGLNERPQTVLQRMLDACAGRVFLQPNGKVRLKVGAWVEPTFTLTFADLIEVQEVTAGPDILDRYNELPARFNSHDLGHIEVDAQAWRDDARIAADGEVLPGPSKSLLMSPSHRQTRQVMEIMTERDNPTQRVQLLCLPRALPAIYEDTIKLNIPEMGMVGDYEVKQHAASFKGAHLAAISLTLDKINAAAFTQSLADQGAVQELPEPDTPSGVPLPQNFAASGVGAQTSTNTFTAGIGAAWQAPPSDALSPRLRITPTGQDKWQIVPVTDGATSASIPALVDGAGYDLDLAFVTPGGVIGDVVALTDIKARAASDPPAPPTALAVSDNGDSTALVEFTASVSASLWKTEIYRDTALVGVVYAGPGSDVAFIDNCGAGTFNWTARSVNVSNINSASDAGPVTATIA